MQLVTQGAAPRHLVPQVVICFCHAAWVASFSHILLSASVHLGADTIMVDVIRSSAGSTKPVHDSGPNAAVSQAAAFKQETQSGVLPPMHFTKQCCAVHPARSPKHVAQSLLHPSSLMQLVTQGAAPRHLVPQVVICFCHAAWVVSFSHIVLSASVHLGADTIMVDAIRSSAGSTKPVHESGPNAAVSQAAAFKQETQ